MKTIEYKGQTYPAFQKDGNAARFIMPFALEFCIGIGYDIGCNRLEWSLPASIPVDPAIDDRYHALHLPYPDKVDYIFSSHMLEHCSEPWYKVLKYWYNYLKVGGVMMLYLPHYDQLYWRPWNNNKHKQIILLDHVLDFMIEELNMGNIFLCEKDMNDSFAIVAQKIDDKEFIF